jgi:hypothetical protein
MMAATVSASSTPTPPPSRYVTPAKLAVDLSRIFNTSITVATLAKWRWSRRGPAFIKIGRDIRYAVKDVEQWVSTQRRGER